jgi:hypothetical protein
MFKQHLALAITAARAAATRSLPERWRFRNGWQPETQKNRAAWFAACREVRRSKGEAYAARLRAAVLAVNEGVPLAYGGGQEGGVFRLPYPNHMKVWGRSRYRPNDSAIFYVDNAVSARGLYRQLKGYYPTWEELDDFVQEVCAPRTPHREGRALRGCPILRDLADG